MIPDSRYIICALSSILKERNLGLEVFRTKIGRKEGRKEGRRSRFILSKDERIFVASVEYWEEERKKEERERERGWNGRN